MDIVQQCLNLTSVPCQTLIQTVRKVIDIAEHPCLAVEGWKWADGWSAIIEWETFLPGTEPAAAKRCNKCGLQTSICQSRLNPHCADTQDGSVMAMIVLLQQRLDLHLDGDRKLQFFLHVLRYLTTTSGIRVELQSWMITSYEVEFGPKIGSGHLCASRPSYWHHIVFVDMYSEFPTAVRYS